MLRAWFLLTLAYGIGSCIAALLMAVYKFIKGRVPSSKDFSEVFVAYLIFYTFSLFVMWALSALSQKRSFSTEYGQG